jgi:hypothetical protein
VAGAALVAVGPATPAHAEPAPSEFVLEDPRIVESSGLQASHRHPGIYWTHNDSDYAPEIYAVDSATGRTVATVTLQGVEFRDVEGIHLGPDGALYVGDIGDNFDGAWPEVWIYRFEEPAELADTTLTPDVYPVRYDDGPRDAEALMVHPVTGRVYVVSKKDDGSGALYRAPEELSPEGGNVLERVAGIDLWVTDGAFSPDGTRLLLRGYFAAEMFRWTDDAPESAGMVRVPMQRQGESVTFTPDGRTAMFGSEGEASAVEPEELTGELLPDSARAEDADADDGADDGDEDTAGGAPGDADAGTGGGRGDADDGDGGLSAGLLVPMAVAAGVLAVTLRRVFRGSGRRRAD